MGGADEPISEIEQLRQLFEKAPGFMAATHGPTHIYQMANASYLELVGPRELIGRSVAEAFPDLADTGFVALLDKVYASGEAHSGRSAPLWLRRRPDGPLELRHLDYVFQPITTRAGRVTGLFVEGYDITDRHEAELALRESEERFRLIADSAPVPIWVTKLDRNRGFVNRAYVDFLGISYEEAVDFDWRSVLHPDDLDRVVAESVAGEASLQTFVLEARYRRADGEWRWLRSESQPRLGPNGEHIGFIGVAHDITAAKQAEEALERRVEAEVAERLRAEEALRQAQKMEAVGQLTGGIAHDFNNLLTPILGGLELITRHAGDERTQRIAGTALEAARRGAKLTSQLLAFSRLQRVSMSPVQINRVITGMQDLLRHSVGQAVRIDIQLDENVGNAVGDINQLENAILNLGINARDAMPDGGTLTISTERVEMAGEPDLTDGPYVCLTVADTGLGMTPDVRQRAAEPFFSTKPLGKGTGLGLAQVYGIARQSGGTLRIDSAPGEGTRVRLLLPAAVSTPQTEPDEHGAEVPAGDMPGAGTILVIDDDRDVRAFLSAALEGSGFRVQLAEDGPGGLARIEAALPDLVLLDFAMPAMNGAEVARIARASHPQLPIVFVTGYAETDQLEAALGPDAPILRKPFTVAQLAAVLERHLPARSIH
jgi:PAS domain S-box-containing protein